MKATGTSRLHMGECEDVSTVSDHRGKSSQVVVTTSGTEAKRSRAKRAISTQGKQHHSIPVMHERIGPRPGQGQGRARTREKKWMSGAMSSKDGGNQWASSSLPFDTIEEEESGRHDLKSSLDLVAEVEERCQHDKHFNERATHEVPLEGAWISPSSYLGLWPQHIMSINDTIDQHLPRAMGHGDLEDRPG